MDKKTIFFDIDSTLLGTKDGRMFQIPPSTLEALKLLKKNGHLPVICSGRQEAFIKHYFPGIFQSYIAMNGTHIVYEGQTVLDLKWSAEYVTELMDYFDQFNCRYIFEGKRHGWAKNIPEESAPELNRIYGFDDFLVFNWNVEDICTNKIDLVYLDKSDYKNRTPVLKDDMILTSNPGGTIVDLCFKNRDKASGIKTFLEYANIPKSDTFAFGDGYNDVTMMGAVGCGIAMGNAVDDVKNAASYVTADIFDDGIYKGLKHFGLI